MKKLILTIVMMFVLGNPTPGVAAQFQDETEGMETSFSREFMGEDSYSGDVLRIAGGTFDSEENAKKSFEWLVSDLEKAATEASDENELEELDVVDGGVLAVVDYEESRAVAAVILLDGNAVFVVNILGPDRDSAAATANEIIEFIVGAKVEEEEVTFNEDGTSTGGVFDRIPAVDHELVKDYTKVVDEDMLGTESTPGN